MGGTPESSLFLRHPLPLPLLLFLLLFLSASTHQSKHDQQDLSCVNDYMGNVSCVWNCSNHPIQVSDQCILQANINKSFLKESAKCEMMTLAQDHCYKGCLFQFKKKDFSFMIKAVLEVKCSGSYVKSGHLHFAKHIKLRPPGIPSIAQGVLSWSPGTTLPRHITQFTFELQYKREGEPWKDSTPTPEQQLELEGLFLGVRYQARVRVKPITTHERSSYGAKWSEWSPVLTWTSDVGDPPPTPLPHGLPLSDMEIGLLSGGLCLTVVVILWLIRKAHTLSCCSSLKMRSQDIPDPSRYFQPLYSAHEGDFQKWLNPMYGPDSFAGPQPSDSISPVEVVPVLDPETCEAPGPLALLQEKSHETWTGSGQSSCYSNRGYFYSECQPGLLHIESCSIYFTYPPKFDGSVPDPDTSRNSYERLEQIHQLHSCMTPDLCDQQAEPLSPDSGFGTEMNRGEGVEEEEEEWRHEDEEKHFTLHLHSLGIPITIQTPLSSPISPPELTEPTKKCEDPVSLPTCTSSPPGGSLARSASMIIQPCGSGYLTVKEMQNTYSNKSI